MRRPHTRVYLTFDLEGAEVRTIRGRRWPPQGYAPRVWGRFTNQREELGLPFVLDALAAARLTATFFVETCGATVFGEDQLADICAALRRHGHDVQLHTHPIQASGASGSDLMSDRDEEAQAALLRTGLDVLRRCGIPAGDLLAYRAGGFAADNRTWRAMAAAGLRVSSNYNPAYAHRCRIAVAHAPRGLFAADAGVWELPITTFRQAGGGPRPLQITAVSSREMEHTLWQAHALGVPEVTIVSHPFELFHIEAVYGPSTARGRPNHINRRRLRRLCRFLDANRAAFEVETIGALARRLGAAEARPAALPTSTFTGRAAHQLERLAEQAVKRLDARAPGAVIDWLRRAVSGRAP